MCTAGRRSAAGTPFAVSHRASRGTLSIPGTAPSARTVASAWTGPSAEAAPSAVIAILAFPAGNPALTCTCGSRALRHSTNHEYQLPGNNPRRTYGLMSRTDVGKWEEMAGPEV